MNQGSYEPFARVIGPIGILLRYQHVLRVAQPCVESEGWGIASLVQFEKLLAKGDSIWVIIGRKWLTQMFAGHACFPVPAEPHRGRVDCCCGGMSRHSRPGWDRWG